MLPSVAGPKRPQDRVPLTNVPRSFRDALPEGRLPWRPPPYEYEYDKMPIDILAGSDGLRRAVDAGASQQEISVTCRLDAGSFDSMRTSCLLY